MSNHGERSNSDRSLCYVLFCTRYGPKWLGPILSVYAFALMMTLHFIGVMTNGAELLFDKVCVVAVSALGAVEVLNEVTYWLGRQNRDLAIKLKLVLFWCIFTVGIGTCVYLFSTLDKRMEWSAYEGIEAVLAYLLLSWGLPSYSTSPNWRFLLLHGKLQKPPISEEYIGPQP